jgi:hypothetical protein
MILRTATVALATSTLLFARAARAEPEDRTTGAVPRT